MEPDDTAVILAMKKYGGHFIAALGSAAQRADLNNRRRIKNAFPDYWEQYSKLAAIDARKEQQEQL